MTRNQIGKLLSMVGTIGIQRHKANCLQRDTPRPTGLHFVKCRPGSFRLARMAIEMGTECGNAVSIRAGQTEFHPPDQIVVTPMGLPVGCRCRAGAGMRAIGGWRPADRMALVEMDMHVDHQRPKMAAFQINTTTGHAACRWQHGGDTSVVQQNIDQSTAIAVESAARRQAVRETGGWHAGLTDNNAAMAGEAGTRQCADGIFNHNRSR